jgi:CRISPR/Cas system CSM-associated protein Csm3 (group 7 of RAMP superfamily)
MTMKKHIYRCTLLSDVVISSTSATEEKHQTLHYIPGSYFLGIVAANHYEEDLTRAYALFHDGIVHFGDAHLSIDGATKTLKTPLNLFEFKDTPDSQVWPWHEKDEAFKNHPNKQPKQIRKGYTDAKSIVEPRRDFNLRTAILDGTAKEGALFGYESLCAGQTFVFEIMSLEDSYLELIKAALTGNQRIGRSRSAAYGLVNIEWLREESTSFIEVKKGEQVTVYAEGNLVFFDEHGYPTLTPTAAQLGLPTGKLLPQYTQMQTRNFALYNTKRVTRDAHLYVIEKGSVFTVEMTEDATLVSEKLVGGHTASGFGKVRYNVPFNVQPNQAEVQQQNQPTWQPPFEMPANAHDALAIAGLLTAHQLDAERKESRQTLDKYKNRQAFKAMSGSQWSTLLAKLDQVNAEYLKKLSHAPSAKSLSDEQIKKAIDEINRFITTDQRRIEWDQTGAKKLLEEVLLEASKLKSWPLTFEALRYLFKKLRAQ